MSAVLAAALGVAALTLLLVIHAPPPRTNRSAMLTGSALVTAATVLAANVQIGWSWVGPLAAAAAYVVTVSPRFSLPRRRNRGTARDLR